MRRALIAFPMLLFPVTASFAELSVSFGGPGMSIGIDIPVYPQLQRVPGYPVYYAPGVNTNYFFYDGLYWVYEQDNWYASSWYNGPWAIIDPLEVPTYVLRVPVRYYRHAPSYFHGWRADAAPRWGDHWGASWQQRRGGWDQWNRSSSPAAAPLPTYQRQYSGNRYPQPIQQAVIQTQSYRYQPRDSVAQHNFEQQRAQVRNAPQQQVVQQPQSTRQQPTRQRAAQLQPERQPDQGQAAREAQRSQQQQAERQPPQAQAEHEQRGAQGKGQDRGHEKRNGPEKDRD